MDIISVFKQFIFLQGMGDLGLEPKSQDQFGNGLMGGFWPLIANFGQATNLAVMVIVLK